MKVSSTTYIKRMTINKRKIGEGRKEIKEDLEIYSDL